MPNIALGTSRARLNELKNQRAIHIQAAETALSAGNTAEYQSCMAKAKALNPEIDNLSDMVSEYDKYEITHAPVGNTSDAYDVKNMVELLQNHQRVGFQVKDILPLIQPRNTLLFSGSLTNPVKTSPRLNESPDAQVSSIVDQVRIEDMSGFTSYEESYEKSIGAATSGTPAQVAGLTPTQGNQYRGIADDTFRIAKMNAYNANITKYVDRQISSLTGTPYLTAVQRNAVIALRKKMANLIVNGDGALSSTAMYGITTAKNTVGEDIFFADSSVTAIDKSTLRKIIMGYGGDEVVAGAARLILTKTALAAFGDISKGTGDDTPLYDIAMNGNVGNIKLGGVGAPYTICSDVGSKLLYGDPSLYCMPIFSALTVKLDENYKAGERLLTILGDITLSGNLVADKAFSVSTISQ